MQTATLTCITFCSKTQRIVFVSWSYFKYSGSGSSLDCSSGIAELSMQLEAVWTESWNGENECRQDRGELIHPTVVNFKICFYFWLCCSLNQQASEVQKNACMQLEKEGVKKKNSYKLSEVFSQSILAPSHTVYLSVKKWQEYCAL